MAFHKSALPFTFSKNSLNLVISRHSRSGTGKKFTKSVIDARAELLLLLYCFCDVAVSVAVAVAFAVENKTTLPFFSPFIAFYDFRCSF